MYGALLGDMIGAPYEFSPIKTKDFPLFSKASRFTDDSVMTVAVADVLIDAGKAASPEAVKKQLVLSMKKWGRRYPDGGYGGRFYGWLMGEDEEPYNSFGNGSAMRVSPAGWLYDTLDETRRYARLTAEVTHNHPEGIKGAEAVASAIYLARTGSTKAEIKKQITDLFGYDLSQTCDAIRPAYRFDVTCQGSVPEAIVAFLDSTDTEDAIRNAVSLGGDADTQGCIAGSVAEAYFGVPENLIAACRSRLPADMLAVADRFMKVRRSPLKHRP
ncbi:ADP-ribosylglycohydrolase family protein [Pseudoramibacter sp.]|jgi:ADP-ribosylglycohydrolase|uniref:ADP-ribosylglycohydrolase family protein n=1 Tax=Pseudoramibacter sp. TaxID=2034862 RepID=UPI0025DB11E2|nr:ADP-ribosylglycohydrolase family protein [Pseudoramibacter sp.]MCH4071807.1 ADP-ribosylglycohydrolase family protein [Pseudoramibacter sp.]MCH4105575.1 ADP-ribosylglycohydrolase family protein [Pseudoramibacter sp.]